MTGPGDAPEGPLREVAPELARAGVVPEVAPEVARPEVIPEGPRREGGSEGPRRPLVERMGMAAIALVLAALFGFMAVAAFSSGEPFLAVMGAIGCLMTVWVGGLTLFRG